MPKYVIDEVDVNFAYSEEWHRGMIFYFKVDKTLSKSLVSRLRKNPDFYNYIVGTVKDYFDRMNLDVLQNYINESNGRRSDGSYYNNNCTKLSASIGYYPKDNEKYVAFVISFSGFSKFHIESIYSANQFKELLIAEKLNISTLAFA